MAPAPLVTAFQGVLLIYNAQSSDVKRMRQDNPFAWSKFEGVDDRLWS